MLTALTRPPAERLLASIRAYQHYRVRGGPWAAAMRKVCRLRRNLWSFVTGTDIDVQARIGRNLRLPHPNGVIIHGDAVVGDDCLIMQQVTVGQLADGGAPTLGAGVYLGAGAKVLGPVRLGDGARVGANAVVLCDVPAGATAVGVPARVLLARADRLC